MRKLRNRFCALKSGGLSNAWSPWN
jgi:hypothetical protein